MRILSNFSILLLSFYLVSCGSKSDSSSYTNDESKAQVDMVATEETEPTEKKEELINFVPPALADGTPQTSAVVASAKKIIKNANLKFQVKELKNSSQAIQSLASKYQGYISVSNESTNYTSINNSITIRVPSVNFDGLVEEIQKQSIYLEYKNISAEDVTEEYYDVEARIKTKKEVEARYREILKQAKSIEEIMAVESKLGEIREEIETKEGRLKFLKDQVSYSTVTLEIYETISGSVQPEYGFFAKLWDSIADGWDGLLSFLLGIVRLWPFVLILIGGIYFGRKWWKRRKEIRLEK